MGETLSLFLLTKTEKDLLAPIRLILADITIKYRSLDLTEFSQETIDDLQNKDFADLCAQRDIDTAAALNLSAILTNNKWFSVWAEKRNKTADLTGNDPNNPPWLYTLVTSDNPNAPSSIPVDGNLAFYQLICDDYKRPADKKIFKINPEIFILQTQQALNLSTKYKYIDPDSLSALSTIREVFGGEIYRALVRRITNVDFPLDKPNSRIWSLLETARNTDGQLTFAMEKAGSSKKVDVVYAINFDDLGGNVKITRRLEPYDKAVYIAVSALFNAGQTVISPQTIYHAMGYTGNPSNQETDKILQSVIKMSAAQIYIDNTEEANAYKGFKNLTYRGALLPSEQLQGVIINGGKTVTAIHLFREPPMMTWARERKQITTIPLKLLQAPLSNTNTNLLIRDYLIERISHAKTGTGQKKILFSTLCEKANISTVKERQRLPEKVQRLLDHYKSTKWIKNYHMEKDGVRIDV